MPRTRNHDLSLSRPADSVNMKTRGFNHISARSKTAAQKAVIASAACSQRRMGTGGADYF